LGAVEGSRAAAEVEDLGAAVHHDVHDRGVAGKLAQGGGRQGCAGVKVAGGGDAGAQVGQGGDQVEDHPAAGAGRAVSPGHPDRISIVGAFAGVRVVVALDGPVGVGGCAVAAGEEVGEGVAAAFGAGAGVFEPVVARGWLAGLTATPGQEAGGADRAEVGADPGATARPVADGEPVALGLLQDSLGVVVLALDGRHVGRVVDRGHSGEGVEDGLSGAA